MAEAFNYRKRMKKKKEAYLKKQKREEARRQAAAELVGVSRRVRVLASCKRRRDRTSALPGSCASGLTGLRTR